MFPGHVSKLLILPTGHLQPFVVVRYRGLQTSKNLSHQLHLEVKRMRLLALSCRFLHFLVRELPHEHLVKEGLHHLLSLLKPCASSACIPVCVYVRVWVSLYLCVCVCVCKNGGTKRKQNSRQHSNVSTNLVLRAQIQEHGYGRFESCVHSSEGLLPTPNLT